MLDYIKFSDQKEPGLGYKRRRKLNRPAISKEKVEKDFIDMNEVHDCMTPPSDIKSENLAKSEIIGIITVYLHLLYNFYRIIQKHEGQEIIYMSSMFEKR